MVQRCDVFITYRMERAGIDGQGGLELDCRMPHWCWILDQVWVREEMQFRLPGGLFPDHYPQPMLDAKPMWFC